MKNAKIMILIQILVLTSLFASPALLNNGWAIPTGLVCLALDGNSSCPLTPPVLSVNATQKQLRVAVIVSNSTTLNAFDISLLTNHTILRPAGVDLTGGLLSTGTIDGECVGGVSKTVLRCPSVDTVDTLELGMHGSYTLEPVTGLLFTAIYNVTGITTNTILGFQTGCGSTLSPTSDTPYCVMINNGSIAPIPMAIQTANFRNNTGPGFEISATPPTLTLPEGANGTSLVRVTSIGGFTGVVFLTTGLALAGPATSFALNPLLIPSNGSNYTSLIINTAGTTPSSYDVTISGSSGSINIQTPFTVLVTTGIQPPSFSIFVNPGSLTVFQGTVATSQITVFSLSNFSGMVNLGASVSPSVFPFGPFASLNASSLHVSQKGQNSTLLLVRVPTATPIGIYDVVVTGNNGIIHSHAAVQINVERGTNAVWTVVGFSPSNISSLSQAPGSAVSFAVTVTNSSSINGFAVFVRYNQFVMQVQTIDYSGSILGSGAQVIGECVDRVPILGITCEPLDNPGVLSLILSAPGNTTTAPRLSGTLFRINFKVVSEGFSSLHIILADLTTGTSFTVVPLTTLDAYFNNVKCGNALCTPPNASIGYSPVPSVLNMPVNFNAVGSQATNFGANITSYIWDFGDGFPTQNSTRGENGLPITSIQHVYRFTCNCTATVEAVDSYGIVAFATIIVDVISPDFTIAINPGFKSIQAGSSASFTVALTSRAGFSGSVSLSGSAAPVGIASPPSLTILPSSVTLIANGNGTATLNVLTSVNTPALSWTITILGSGGGIAHSASLQLQVTAPPDEAPVATFTFSPSNTVVGEFVSFDGSLSRDPDGFINSWTWSFGDGLTGFGEFTSHQYNNPGVYPVMLTVSDSGGQSATSNGTFITVIARPLHDVGIVQLNVYPNTVVGTETVFIQAILSNTGTSNETVSITAYANGRPIQTLTGVLLQACTFNFCFNRFYENLAWDTTGFVAGNYTVSATVSLAAGEIDPTPADNSAVYGTVTVLPPPSIGISPGRGVVGTKVTLHGSGFPQFNNLVDVSFDNMSIGFTFTHNGGFTFVFDVPLAQSGAHSINAFDRYSGAHASATFTVQPTPSGSLVVSVDMGTIYFPGDTAVAYVLTTFNGAPVGPQSVQVQVTLFRPDGTNVTLTATSIGAGLYKASYPIPTTASLGTYLVLVKAHQPGPVDASALVSFEVKLTWLNGNASKIVGATTVAGVIGLVAVAWRKGYIRRKSDEEAQPNS